ncbi:hypothetical protein [Methylocystis hirsuta]|uniref:Uncharacterized protein n=1 Tax=Methylocystis hirsuta TaxID=369798 RepID=A0A3M9XNQ3_9HYPH|nr:hypothetical protein [Methylocystis hirsuta]RNJ49382.1 hypothetical protein D1O30_06980 [Methylocystis hirsuta]
MKKRYHTLAEYLPALERWTPQFGDYDRKTVKSELDYMREQGVKEKHLKIVSSAGTQEAINSVCASIPRPA